MMEKTFFCGVLLIISATILKCDAECKSSPTKASGNYWNGKQICSGDLLLNENFDKLDEGLWRHELTVNGNGNGEFQQYVNDRSVSYAEGGNLFILPKVVGDGPLHNGFFNPVQSARMTTAGHFGFTYGVLEVRAKIPSGDWLWPAIWLLPQDNVYGNWPHSGEIDVMESRGNKNLQAWGRKIGTQEVSGTVHFGQNYQQVDLVKFARNDAGFDGDFHAYKLTWTPDFIAFSVDGKETGRITPGNGGFYELGHMSGNNPFGNGGKMAPFDKDFFILLNVAVGGTGGFFPDECTNPGGKPWKNNSPQAARDFWNGNGQWRPTWNEASRNRALQVDYVKVWAL